MLRFRALALLLVASLVFAQQSTDRAIAIRPPASPPEEPRIALVIGNGAYREGPLRNPVNDGRAMAEALRSCGFQVDLVLDADRAGMSRAVREFGRKIANGGVGLFYFAGHGMAVRGSNYLIPVGADISAEHEVPVQALDVAFVLGWMEAARNRMNILVLDACRNNPFARTFRSSSRGLAQMDAPAGSFVAYATAPGSTANDGQGGNGLYTQHLLEALREPGQTVEQVFKRVRVGVKRDSGDQQIPWDSSSLTGEFLFRPGSAPPPAPAPSPARPLPAASPRQGGLQVAVEAPEARVYLDGEFKGTAGPGAPLDLPGLPPGESLLLVEAPGHLASRQTVRIEAGSWSQASPALRKAMKLTIYRRPNSINFALGNYEVWLDGRKAAILKNDGFVDLVIPAGRHTLNVQQEASEYGVTVEIDEPRKLARFFRVWKADFKATPPEFTEVDEATWKQEAVRFKSRPMALLPDSAPPRR